MIEKLEQHYGYLFEDDLIKEITGVAIYKEFKVNSTI
ncbi:MAG: Crp/Fnr family transcriptional regulator, partial [Flavobacteriaceae bacterium]|nr:Crp/Fnr family transcriptional regulator [Flavobacteriaceae bacterium]